MDYVGMINDINEQLLDKGIKSIYSLIANNIGIDAIENIMSNNTSLYQNLSLNEKNKLKEYLSGLILQKQLLGIN